MTDPGINIFAERLATATRCAELGLRTLVGRTDASGNFVPALKFADGLATDDPAVAAHMVHQHSNSDRIAIICGPCKAGNVFALDVDRNHSDGVDGVAELRSRLDALGIDKLPPGPRWRTPRGGLQMLFLAPAGLRIRNMSGKHALAPGVDVKGFNGLATIPPTRRADGAYEWIDGASIADVPILMVPTELMESIREVEYRPAPIAAPLVFARCGDTERDRRQRYIERALASEMLALAGCAKGGRNLALFHAAATIAAFNAGEPGLIDEPTMIERLNSACADNGLLQQDGRRAVDATIRSGLRHGRQGAPRHVPPPGQRNSAGRSGPAL